MKIVFVVFSLRGGGAERVVTRLASAFSHHVKVTIVQLSSVQPFYALPPQVRLIEFKGPSGGPLRLVAVARHLYASLRRENPDVVLSFGETINPFVILVGGLARQKVMVANRASPLASLRGRRAWLNPILYRRASAVIVQTHRAIELLSKRYRNVQWIVSENPLVLPAEILDDQARENHCVTIGYLGGKKNQRQLIESFLRVAPSDWKLVIVGDGPDRAALEQLVQERSGADRVTFTGAVKDVDTVLRSARVFAFTSLSEGFPNALAEAMAHGCACIALDCPTGPAELIEHGRSGFLIQPSDRAGFDNGLAQLLGSSSLRVTFGREARRRAEQLSASRVALDLLEEIEMHLDPRGQARRTT